MQNKGFISTIAVLFGLDLRILYLLLVRDFSL